MSTIPRTAGTSCASMPSMPCRRVTSAMPHPWHPPPIRSITTASCTSMSSTRPPCRATIGFTCSSKTFATCSYNASSLTANPPPETGFGAGVTAGTSAVNVDRIALPTARPTACHGTGDCFTTVTMLPETISSVTPRPGREKIASASGEPCASSGAVNRRTPPASTGTLTTNLQRWLSIGSAVIRISSVTTSLVQRLRFDVVCSTFLCGRPAFDASSRSRPPPCF